MKEIDSLSLTAQLGRRIAYLRRLKKMSQLDLAYAAGIAKSYASELEAGKRNPSLMTLYSVAEALGVTLEELFRGIAPIDSLLP